MQSITAPADGRGPAEAEGWPTAEVAAHRAGSFSESQRYHAMDALRASMMLLGVAFHAALPYMTAHRMNWFVDPAQSYGFDAFAAFSHTFRMPVFFLAAGFFAALLYQKRGRKGFTRNRFQRIVIPFILGFLILAPLCGASLWFGVRTVQGNSLQAGWDWLATGEWLRWGPVFYLWFLEGLIVAYPLAIGLRSLLLRLPARYLDLLTRAARRFLVSPWRPLFLALPIAAAMIPIQFVHSDDFTIYTVAWLMTYFWLGWVLYAHADLLPQMTRHAWTYIAVALAIAPILAAAHHRGSVSFGAPEAFWPNVVVGVSGALTCNLMLFGILGVFVAHADRPSPTARYLADSSYWVYLIHLPLILFIGALFAVMPWPPLAKWLATLAIAAPILFGSYHYLVRFTPVGNMLNGPRHRGGRPAMAS